MLVATAVAVVCVVIVSLTSTRRREPERRPAVIRRPDPMHVVSLADLDRVELLRWLQEDR